MTAPTPASAAQEKVYALSIEHTDLVATLTAGLDAVKQELHAEKIDSDVGLDRQIIAATHNPNIPMLGDAELVVVLEARNNAMSIASRGSIDSLEIRTHIRQVLEGGEDAFMRRY